MNNKVLTDLAQERRQRSSKSTKPPNQSPNQSNIQLNSSIKTNSSDEEANSIEDVEIYSSSSSSSSSTKTTTILSTSKSTEIRAHLKCSICHELYYKPTTLPCGHSFCRHCLLQVANVTVMVSTDECKCPACRALFALRVSSFQVSTPLWNVITALFPNDIVDREADAEYIFKTESAKLVSKEHVPNQNVPLPSEFVVDNLKNYRRLWRSVQVNKDDIHMRQILALASFPRVVNGEILDVGICALIMEEDEVTADEGYPILVAGDDKAFIDTTTDMRCGQVSFSLFPIDRLSDQKVPPSYTGDSFTLLEKNKMRQGKANVTFDISGLDPGCWHLCVTCEKDGDDIPLRLDLTFRISGPNEEEDEDEDDSDGSEDEDGNGRKKTATYQGGSGFVMVSDSEDEDDDDSEDEYDDGDGFVVNDDEPIEFSGEEEEEEEDSDDDDSENEQSEDILIMSSNGGGGSRGDERSNNPRPAKRRRTVIISSDSDDDSD